LRQKLYYAKYERRAVLIRLRGMFIFRGINTQHLVTILSRSQRDHGIDGMDLATDDVLDTQVRRKVAEDPL